MEKFPTSDDQSKDSFSDINPWVGSPEHFEQAKAQNQSDSAANWDDLAKWREEQGPAPWNDSRWQTPPNNYETSRPDAIASALQDYTAEDIPNGSHQRVTRKQLDPATVGMFTAAAFMAVELLGIGNSPSDLILDNYAAATTLLASGAAATGALAGKLTADLNTRERLNNAKHAKKDERSIQ